MIILHIASAIIVDPVPHIREVPRNCDSVACTVFPTKILGADIYSSTTIYGSMVLTNAVKVFGGPSMVGLWSCRTPKEGALARVLPLGAVPVRYLFGLFSQSLPKAWVPGIPLLGSSVNKAGSIPAYPSGVSRDATTARPAPIASAPNHRS